MAWEELLSSDEELVEKGLESAHEKDTWVSVYILFIAKRACSKLWRSENGRFVQAYVAGEVLLVISGMWRYVEISNLMISLERFEVINAWRCSSDGGKLDENCSVSFRE